MLNFPMRIHLNEIFLDEIHFDDINFKHIFKPSITVSPSLFYYFLFCFLTGVVEGSRWAVSDFKLLKGLITICTYGIEYLTTILYPFHLAQDRKMGYPVNIQLSTKILTVRILRATFYCKY